MLRVKTRTGHISDLAKCFKLIAIFILLLSTPCYGLSVSGVPEWLEPAVTRSLKAVWEEIPNSPEIDREATLSLVAARLFAGYKIRVVSKHGEPIIYFDTYDEIKTPEIKINIPPTICIPVNILPKIRTDRITVVTGRTFSKADVTVADKCPMAYT